MMGKRRSGSGARLRQSGTGSPQVHGPAAEGTIRGRRSVGLLTALLVGFGLLFSMVHGVAEDGIQSSPAAGWLPDGTDWLKGIHERELMADLQFLASNELRGRKVLSPGSRTTAVFLSSRFAACGLAGGGDRSNGFYQEVPLIHSEVDSGETLVELRGNGPETRELVFDRHFGVRIEGPAGFDVSGALLFAGYGIRAPEYEYDDYKNADPAGKVVLVFEGEPSDSDPQSSYFRGRRMTRHAVASTKARIAREQGAVAVIIAPAVESDGKEGAGRSDGPGGMTSSGEREYIGLEDEETEEPFPLIHITDEALAHLTAMAGAEPAGLFRRLEQSSGGCSLTLEPLEIRCRLTMSEPRRVSTRNVLGIMQGRDEHLFQDFVVVSAHYDHLGIDGEGRILPGADDNASGVSALLAAARVLAALPPDQRPRRSILFAAWAGEEKGVLGSTHYLEHPTVPLGQNRVLLNMDMVGRNNMDREENRNVAAAFYSAQAPDLEAALDSAAEDAALDLRLRPMTRMHGNSDHRGFHDRGIPVIHFFTGLHRHYNSPDDRAEQINGEKLVRVARLVARLAYDLADGDRLPEFDESIAEPRGRKDPFDLPF